MARTLYQVKERPGEGLALLISTYGQQLWSLAKTRAHTRNRDCQLCDQEIEAGALAYRPTTNAANRMERIHQACLDAAPLLSDLPKQSEATTS